MKSFIFIFLFISCSVKAQDKWPDIPLLEITTVDNIMPTATIIHAPEGCVGTSITDNDYVPGRMIMTLNGEILYDSKEYEKNVSGMRIKRRGNSTGAYLDQHPYKIKLTKKEDLLRRNEKAFKHKEWLLLSMYTWNVKMSNQESNVLNIGGLLVSKALNKEWTPAFEFVNVVLNGEYQGMYYLMESVDKGEKRVNISETGFLIEHDPFWWNENVYFKTNHQNNITAFSYKYPDDDEVTEDTQNVIKDYMNSFEDALYNNTNDINQYIDIVSFAKWILIHDILGTDDALGCNRFICKYNINDDSKLQMGPLWDYDSMFRSDDLSSIHSWDLFYYPSLFTRQDFKKIYINLWMEVKDHIKDYLHQEFQSAKDKYGEVFDESMKLHQTKYPNEGKQSFNDQIDEVEEKLAQRIIFIDNYVSSLNDEISSIRNTRRKQQGNLLFYNMNGQHIQPSNLHKGLFIKVNEKGTACKVAIVR